MKPVGFSRHPSASRSGTRAPRQRLASLLVMAGLLAGLLPLPATVHAGAFDVGVGAIHVTQGVQHSDPRFRVPLVAERSTAVRVHVMRVQGTPGPVTGMLKLWVNGQELTPPGGIPDLNRSFPPPHDQFIPPAGPFADLLAEEQHTLNFELPATLYPIAPPAGQTTAHDVDLEVTIVAAGDSDPANNVGRVDDLTVVRRGTPWLFKDRVIFLPGGGPPASGAARPRESFIMPGKGDVMAAAIWPIADAPTSTGTQTHPLYPPLLPGMTHTVDCDGDGRITAVAQCFNQAGTNIGDEQGMLLYRLALRRQLLVQGGFGPDRLVYLFGWVRDGNLAGHDGVSLVGGNIGYGIDADNRGQQVFAHEFGHMVGLPHNMPGRTVDQYGWDVGARLHNHPVAMAHGVTGRVKPRVVFGVPFYGDIMNDSASATTANTWIDLQSYAALLNDPKLASVIPEGPCQTGKAEGFETLVIAGMPAGNSLRAGVFRYPWCTSLSLRPERPNLLLTIELQAPGAEIRTLELPIEARTSAGPDKDGGDVLGPFAVPVPVVKGSTLHAVRIRSLADELRPTELRPTAHAPTIAITSPAAGAKLGSKTTIAWKAADRDAGTTLSFQVAYSPNDGRDWVPVAVDLETTSITIDATQLPATREGQGRLRVVASDGVHSSYADLRALSI